MVSLSRATPFPTLQAAAPPQAADQTQRPRAAQALTTAGQVPPTQGTPAPDLAATAIKLLKVVVELLAQLLGGQGGQPAVSAPDRQPAQADGGLDRNGNVGGGGGGKMAGGHWGVVHTCKSGWITPEVKELTKYGYNPLRQGVGTPYDSAVSSWERDHGRKFPGLQF